MSGHSHAKTVLHKKRLEDAKRGKIFSKLSRLISVAARQGEDPETNPKLKQALEQAKQFNFPKENIEKAIKRGTGEGEGVGLEEFMFEAYGPGKTAIIIEGITDNRNRTLNEIKQILAQHKGKLADAGSVKWLFERKGCVIINQESRIKNQEDKENLELLAIEAGAEDIYWHEGLLDVYTKPDDLEKVKKNLQAQKIKIESASLDWIAKDTIEVEQKQKQACKKIFEALDDNDAVQEIYSNLKV